MNLDQDARWAIDGVLARGRRPGYFEHGSVSKPGGITSAVHKNAPHGFRELSAGRSPRVPREPVSILRAAAITTEFDDRFRLALSCGHLVVSPSTSPDA